MNIQIQIRTASIDIHFIEKNKTCINFKKKSSQIHLPAPLAIRNKTCITKNSF